MDRVTGRSRGTGFACFWNKEDADKAIEQSSILRAETIGSEPPVVCQSSKVTFTHTDDTLDETESVQTALASHT